MKRAKMPIKTGMFTGTLKVKIFDANGTRLLPLAKSTVTVGQAPHCDVVVEHSTVQAEHVRAWLEGGRIWIQDLGAPTGTFLNGVRLPALKPMLVRDLDVLKLGEAPATLGIEANLVRAPVVKSKPAVNEEFTVTDVRPLTAKRAEADQETEKRRGELADVSRELAELKLQLQMVQLEKNSSEEIRKQIHSLREEARQLDEQKKRVQHDIAKYQKVDEERRRAVESEIFTMREKAERELRELRDNQGRKLGHWKVDAVAELNNQVHLLTQAKAKAWVTRPLSQDMIFEWESDLNLLFRRVLLNEEGYVVPPAPSPGPSASRAPSARAVAAEPEKTSRSQISVVTGLSQISAVITWPRWNATYAYAALAFVILIGGLFFVLHRSGGTSRTAASLPGSPAAAPVATSPAPASVPAVPAPHPTPASRPAAVVAAVTHAPPPVRRFTPRQTKSFKKSYTENVLYTENYVASELNREMQRLWLADLRKTGRSDWHVNDKTINAVIAKERQLIHDLLRLREDIQPARAQDGIHQMQAREGRFQQELRALLGARAADRFLQLKRSFFARNVARM